MFRLDPNPQFWAPVRLTVPGESEPVEIELQFVHKGVDALREWIDGARENNDRFTVAGIVCGWKGVDAAFSEEALTRLLQNYPVSASEIFEQYLKALTESRAKN